MNLNFDLDREREEFRNKALNDWPGDIINPDDCPPNYFATRVDFLPQRKKPQRKKRHRERPSELYRYNVLDYDYKMEETWLNWGEIQAHRIKVFDLGLTDEREIYQLAGHLWPNVDNPMTGEQYFEAQQEQTGNAPASMEERPLDPTYPYQVANVLITDPIRQAQIQQYKDDQPQHDYRPAPKLVEMWCGYNVPGRPILSKGCENGFDFRDQHGMMTHTYLTEAEHEYFGRLGWGEDDYNSQNSFEAQFPMEEVVNDRYLQGGLGRQTLKEYPRDYFAKNPEMNDAEMTDADSDVTMEDSDAADEAQLLNEAAQQQAQTQANFAQYYSRSHNPFRNRAPPAGNPYVAAAGAPKMPEMATWGPTADQPRAARPKSRLSNVSFPYSPAAPVAQRKKRQPKEKKWGTPSQQGGQPRDGS